MDATRLHTHVRGCYALARASMVTILSTLSRTVNRRLTRNERIRLSNVNFFHPGLIDARPMARGAGHGGAGMELGKVICHPSQLLVSRIKGMGIRHAQFSFRSDGLASRRVSTLLARFFAARSFIRQGDFRLLYDVARDATDHRLRHLYRRKGLGGIKLPGRPICGPVGKCCIIGR